MIGSPMMAASECQEVVNRLLMAFPNVSGDVERCQEVSRKMEQFPYAVALQAVEEYVNHGGDKFLELTRLLAVAFRIHRELREREASITKALERKGERERARHISHALDSVVDFIADMTDEDVMGEWRHVVGAMKPGKPREWCEQYGAAKVRGNVRFQLRMSELMKGRQQVA